jgi:hypothetical protein
MSFNTLHYSALICSERKENQSIYRNQRITKQRQKKIMTFHVYSNSFQIHTELLNVLWSNKKHRSAVHTCHLYYSYLLLPLPLLSRYNLSKCVRIQFLPPFSPTIFYSMFVLFMRTQRKPPWKLFVTEMADIAWLIPMSMSLDTNTTKPNANIIRTIINAFLMPI